MYRIWGDAVPSSKFESVGCGGSQPPIPNTHDLEADNSINAALKASLRGAAPYTEHTHYPEYLRRGRAADS
jgi:hypothetical protein